MNEIKRMGGTINAVVVQLPERNSPGVVIQRDSLQNLLYLAQDAKRRSVDSDWEEVDGIIDELIDILTGYVGAFDMPQDRS